MNKELLEKIEELVSKKDFNEKNGDFKNALARIDKICRLVLKTNS